MRKRCIGIADSRVPLKTLKSSVLRSNIKEVPRAAKIPRFHSMKGEVIDNGSAPFDCVVTNENVCPNGYDENEENAAVPVGRKRQNVDAACKEREGTMV